VTQRELEDHCGPLLFSGIFGEARADPAEREELERDGLRGVRPFECLAETLARLGAVSERECRKADAAERRDQPQRWLLSENAS